MKFLGVIEGQGLYARWVDKHNQIRYSLDGQDVGVCDLDVMEEPILFMNNTKANELSAMAKETIQNFAENVDLEELKQNAKKYGQKGKGEIAEALGLEKENLVSITEVELDQEINEKIGNHKGKGEAKKETNKNSKQQEKLATIKDINIKQELKMDTMATDMRTVGKILQDAGKMPKVEGKTFTKLGIVESDAVKDIHKNAKTNTTRFSFVAIASDGSVVPVNLEQDHQEGANPRDISYNTRAYGQVEQDDVNSRYRVGDSGETLSIKFSNGPGEIEVGYSSHKTVGGDGISGNKSMDTQLETSTVYWKTRTEIRQTEFRGYRQAEDKYQEAKQEGKTDIADMKPGDKGVSTKATYKETDGREDTKSHEHESEEYEGRVPWDGQGRRR